MVSTIYALLVGVNEYLGGVPRLHGCVNDVQALQEFLTQRTAGGEFALTSLVLTAGDPERPDAPKPTRQAVIDGFRQHLCQAGTGDIALFYYSGHGSQEKAPPQFWHIEPDHLDETIVCYDSRTADGWDLADKELALLIAEVAKKQPHILVILDACHSGSGTRASEGTGVRLAPMDLRDRPLDSFLPGVVQTAAAAAPSQTEGGLGDIETGNWFALPHGRHVVISACRPEESAREKAMENGQLHGVLTYYLLDTLRQVGPSLTYREVFNRTNTLVRNLISDQQPMIAVTNSDDLKQPFLGGAILEQMPYYDVDYEKDDGWVIKAGAIHGIAPPVGAETTHLAVFPLGHQIKIGDSLDRAIGQASVIKVSGVRSRIALEMHDGATPDQKQAYKAVVVSTPLLPVAVHLSGDDQMARDLLREQLAQSLIVRPVDDPAVATIRVLARQDDAHYRLQRAGDLQPLSVSVPQQGTRAAATVAAAKVEHMAQWLQVLNLENKQTQLPPDAVRLELYQYDPASQHSQPLTDETLLRLRYDPQQDNAGAYLQIRLVHTGTYVQPLYCMLVDLTDDFAVDANSELFGGGIWLRPGEDVWATSAAGEKFLSAYVPEALWAQGVTQIRDVLKLIVSTDESDAWLLKQNGLEVVVDNATRGMETSRKVVPPSTLSRVMQRVQTRAIGSRPQHARLSDWRTTQVLVTTECLGGGVDIPSQPDQSAILADGVMLQGHAGLRAKAEIVSFDAGKRELGNLALPALFRNHPELAEPWHFRPGRGGDAGASVIVLRDVANPGAVTPEAPLVIRAAAPLTDTEAVLPVGFDPANQLYLPLGIGIQDGHHVKIVLDRLPDPTSDSRDVAGSIKLFFHKVIADKIGAERFGLDGKTVRLAAATIDMAGRVIYDESPIRVLAKVKNANRILLYIHGIVGDTNGMIASTHGLQPTVGDALPRLVDHYDLILAFDYENINTPIAETATKLKQALVAVGLGPHHDKTLHVVTHSLGSLVTRWFIERDSGSQVIHKAMLVGPPNAGSPWAKLQDYALLGLGAALNGLAALLAPPVAIATLIGTLVAGVKVVEAVDVTLDEMKPDSSFYKILNASDDPRVPYTIIVGNTSKIVYAQPDNAEAERRLLHRLAERLTSAKTRYILLDLAFFNHPNDMAVSVQSMISLPSNRQPEPKFVEVACDHVSYFNTAAVVRQVAEGLLQE